MSFSKRPIGTLLMLVGAILIAIFCFAIRSVPLMAFGLSAIILAFTDVALARTISPMPDKAVWKPLKLTLSMGIAFCVTVASFAYLRQNDIGLYFNTCAIVYLTIASIYLCFNPTAKRPINVVSSIIFAGFLVIMGLKVIELLK